MAGNDNVDQRIQKQMIAAGQAQMLKAGQGDRKPPGRLRKALDFGKRYVPGTDARKAHKSEKIANKAEAEEEGRSRVRKKEAAEAKSEGQTEAVPEKESQPAITTVGGAKAIAASDSLTKFDSAFKEALRRGKKKSRAKKEDEDITSDMAIMTAVCRKEFAQAVLAGTATTPMEDISDAYEENMWPVRRRLAEKLNSGRIADLSKQELDIIYSTMLGMKYQESRTERNERMAYGAEPAAPPFWNEDTWPESNGPTPPQAFFRFLETVAMRVSPGNEAVFLSQVLLGLKHYGRDDETTFPTEQMNVLSRDPIADPELISDYIREKTAEPVESTAREFKKLVYDVLTTPAAGLHPELEVPGFGYPKKIVTSRLHALDLAEQAEQRSARALARIKKAIADAKSEQVRLEGRRDELQAKADGMQPGPEKDAALKELSETEQAMQGNAEGLAQAEGKEDEAKDDVKRFTQERVKAQKALLEKAPEYADILKEEQADNRQGEAEEKLAKAQQAAEAADAALIAAQEAYNNAMAVAPEKEAEHAQALAQVQEAAGERKAELSAAEAASTAAGAELAAARKEAKKAGAAIKRTLEEEAKADNLAKQQEDAFKTALVIHGNNAAALDAALESYQSNVTNFRLKSLVERVDVLLRARAPLADVFATPSGAQLADPTAGLPPEVANTARIIAAVDALKAQQAVKAAPKAAEAEPEIPPLLKKERQALQYKKDRFDRDVAKFMQDIEAAQLPEDTKIPLREIGNALKDFNVAAEPLIAKIMEKRQDTKEPGYNPLDFYPIRKAARLAMKKREEEELKKMDDEHSHNEITHKQWVLVSAMVESAEQVEGEKFPAPGKVGRFKKWFMRNIASPGDGMINLFKWVYKWTGLKSVFGDRWMTGPRRSGFFGVREGTSGYLSADKRNVWRHQVDEHGVKMSNKLSHRLGFIGALKLTGIVFSASLAFVPVLRAYWLRAPWNWFAVADTPGSHWYNPLDWRLNPPASDRTLHKAPTIGFIVRLNSPTDFFWGPKKQFLGDIFPWNWDWSGPHDPTSDELRTYRYNDNYAIPERLAARVDPESDYFAGEDFFTARYGVGHRLPGETDDKNAKARLEWLRKHPEVLKFLDERDRLSRVTHWEILDDRAKIPDNDQDDKNNKPVCVSTNNGKNKVCHPLYMKTEPIKDGWRLNQRLGDQFIEALRALETQHTTVTYEYLNRNLRLWEHDGYLIKRQEAALMDWAGLDVIDNARFLLAQPQAVTLLAPLLSRGESELKLYLDPQFRDGFINAWKEELKKAVPGVDAMFESVPADRMQAAFDATIAGVKAGPMAAMLVDCTEDYNRRLVMNDVDKIRMEMGVPSLAPATVDALVQHSELRDFFLKFTATNATEELDGATFDEFVGSWLLPLVESDKEHAAEKLEEFDPFTEPQGSRVQWAEGYGYMKKAPVAPAAGEAAAEEGATPPLSDEARKFYGNLNANGGVDGMLANALNELYEATGADGDAMRRAYGGDRTRIEEAVRSELYRMLNSAGQNDGDATSRGDADKCKQLGISVTGTGDAMQIKVDNGAALRRGLHQYIVNLVSRPAPQTEAGAQPASGTATQTVPAGQQ